MKTLVEVIWMDAATDDVERKDLKDPKDMLYKQVTYGRIFDFDDEAIIICQGENKDEISYTTIPNQWIKKIIYYERQSKKGVKGTS